MQDQSSARLLKMQSEQSGSAGGKLCLLFVVILFLFTVYCLLFTVYCSLFTVHCSLFTVHCSSLFTVFITVHHCSSLFTVHCSLLITVHCSLFTQSNILSSPSRFCSLFKLKGGLSSYRHRASEQELRDEYGNVFSGAHVLARLTEAGKMLGSKSWVRSVCSIGVPIMVSSVKVHTD
jgi:hypothetical protein